MRIRLLVPLVLLVALGGGAVSYQLFVGGRGGQASTRDREAAIREFCALCHKFPAPDTVPRWQWKEKIETMYELTDVIEYTPSGEPPPVEDVIDFYVSRAPAQLPPVDTTVNQGPGPLKLKRNPIKLQGFDPYPGVANVQFVHLLDREHPELLITEMRHNLILLLSPSRQQARIVGHAQHPCRTEVVDLDGDGHLDLLVSALGTVTPSDVLTGSVVWLRGDGKGNFKPFTLISGVGRVADARAADFDGDGDCDVVVAVFGWRKYGETLYLDNQTTDYDAPRFEPFELDPRPGGIHVPIADLNGDGRPDFVALISQHHETVVAFLNVGWGLFEQRTIYAADHPNWGSNGIELLDFDGDGDLDVLFVNGDTLDDLVVKPYHGIQWLENRGGYPFTPHRLTQIYGATAVGAGDFDGDGDLDIVASIFLPYLKRDAPEAQLVESLIWLEQTAPRRFQRHSLEAVSTYHPTLDVSDYDGDGDLDIAVGNMTMAQDEQDKIENWVLLLENERI